MPQTGPCNPFELLARHYDAASEAYRILVTHSILVARKARTLGERFLERHPEADLDLEFLTEAALLHDIGIGRCHAPEIGCTGAEPYIRHGVAGREILEVEGLPRHALVCERHTGSGITTIEIEAQGLPLPPRDYLPVSLEEKLICVADKFYSKDPRKLWREKRPEKIARQIERHGPAAAARWKELAAAFLPG